MKSHFYILGILLLCCFPVWGQIVINNKITGIEDPALKNILTRLQVIQKELQDSSTSQKIQEVFEKGPEQIRLAMQPYGYFKTAITEQISREEENYTFYYHISPGPRLHLTEVDVKVTGPGKNNINLKKFLGNFPLKVGDPFDATKYEDTKVALFNFAREHGYLRAKLTNDKIIIHTHDYFCSIIMHLDTGPQFYFGNVYFSKTPLNDNFLRRYLNFKPNDREPVSSQKLLTFQQALSGGNYFQNVSVVPQIDHEKNYRVPIKVNLTMRKRKEYRFGVGYGTNSGPRATIGLNINWLNQYGHKLYLLAKLSHIESTLAAQYLIPGKNPVKDHYAVNASIFWENPQKGQSFTKSIGVSRITSLEIWQRTLSLDFQYERYRFNTNQPFRRSKLLMPTITFSKTQANDRINITDGNRLSLMFRGATGDVVSTVSFLQTLVEYKWIRTFMSNNLIILRGQYGYTVVDGNLLKLPLTKHFYTGGIDSVRGYQYQGLGPGRYLVIGSAEYQRRIYGNWYAATFYDIGNAFDHFSDPLMRGTGVGVVWNSPMGALRFYVSCALSKKNRPWRIDFSFGPNL